MEEKITPQEAFNRILDYFVDLPPQYFCGIARALSLKGVNDWNNKAKEFEVLCANKRVEVHQP